ncbi:MAG: hypothetical protein KJO69_08600, partial [Gammaproteobacteria bacterium]|nr:hypothetical protein [Gammaproteobacteria bacterium]
MATIGRWTGGTIGSLVPTTSWAAPNGLFPTQNRNDSSAYSFTSSTSTLTLPSTDLADGYLIRATVEYHYSAASTVQLMNFQAKIIQASGTGNFVSPQVSGTHYDGGEDRIFLHVVAFVDNPSAAATFQFQWQRFTKNAPAATNGTVNSAIEVVPFYYSNIGMYSEATTVNDFNTTTTEVVTLGTTVTESDTNAIQIASNVVTVKGNNKRYFVIGSMYMEGVVYGATHQSRTISLEKDGT